MVAPDLERMEVVIGSCRGDSIQEQLDIKEEVEVQHESNKVLRCHFNIAVGASYGFPSTLPVFFWLSGHAGRRNWR